MSQNGQTHIKKLSAFFARFLKCGWPFYDVLHKGLTLDPSINVDFAQN